MRESIFIVFLSALLFACSVQNKEEQSVKETEAKTVELQFFDAIDFLTVEEIDRIPLETTEESLIGEISKVIFHGDSIYILDSRYGKKIYCFSNEGKFLFSFGKFGEAGDEYEVPKDFVIKDDQIIVVDNQSISVLRYDLQGNFLEKERITRVIYEFEKHFSGIYIAYIPTDYVLGESFDQYSKHTIQLLNHSSFEENKGWLPYQEGLDDAPFSNVLAYFDDQIRYIHPIYGFIFTIDEKLQARKTYSLDFGEYSWPLEWEQFVADQEEAERLFFEGGIMTMCHNILEDDNFIYLNALTQETSHTPRKLDGTETKWLLLIDKKSGEGYAAPQIVAEDLPPGYQYPIARTEDAFVSLIIDDQENFEEVKNPTLLVHQFRKNAE